MANDPIQALRRQQVLLRMEYEAEKAAFQLQTEKYGVERKVSQGVCWFPVQCGQSYYNSLNQLVVEIHRSQAVTPEHSFEYGKPVCFFSLDKTSQRLRYLPHTGVISYVQEDLMVVSLPQGKGLVDLAAAENLGVQLYFDELSYRCMFDALDHVIQADSGRLVDFREIFHGNAKPRFSLFNPLRFPWLNQAQEEAVNQVLLAKDVAIVHGPPGTGKTTTLVEAIHETLRRETQVLVCAQSNMAVDWISEQLVDHGIPVIRIGNPTRVNDKMLSFTYERRFEAHPDYAQLWSIRKAIRELRQHRDGNTHKKINSLKDRASELEFRIKSQIFDEARVVACTLVGSANKTLNGMKFPTLFIDEAAQALEAACWIAIQKAGRVILAGDHQQLPPTIKCFEAAKEGLSRTLMQQIAETKPECVTLLKVQYRMNDTIMKFSSDWFYRGELQSDPSVKYRGILDLDDPMEWINTEGLDCNEEFIGESFGRINKPEAHLCIDHLKTYLGKIGKERIYDEKIDLGLVSPYKAQVHYLRQLVKSDPFFKPYRRMISINTVDGFQGQERDIMVISLVRANEQGEIGFLRDLRRMNVAMTRARMKLIILGDASTLTRHPFYKKLYQYIQMTQEKGHFTENNPIFAGNSKP